MTGKGAVEAQRAKLAVGLLLLGNLILTGSNLGTLSPVRSRRCFVKHSMRVRDNCGRERTALWENVRPSEFACKIALKGDLTGSQASENSP